MKTVVALLALSTLMICSTAIAETMYVTNIIKITLRSGPGTDHRVLRMVQSGQMVDVLDEGENWSHVRLQDGTEGWVLSRFVSPDKPSGLLLSALEKKHQKLLAEAQELKKENQDLTAETRRLTEQLDLATAKLNKVTAAYETLKEGSAEYLSLKKKYEQATKDLARETETAHKLEKELAQRNITLFLIGAGVLLFGFIIGFATKKQRKRSLLS